MLYMVETYWRYRHLPNLLFLHYADLTNDLDGEMRRTAAFLDIEMPGTSESRLHPVLRNFRSILASKATNAQQLST